MARLILVWVLVSLLALLGGCGKGLGKVASAALGGGGPNIAANVQAGRTNAQTLGQATIADQRIIRPQARTIEQSTGETGLRTEKVESLIVHQAPRLGILSWAVFVGFLIGLLFPQPRALLIWIRSRLSQRCTAELSPSG
jgi:hypothetical protein